MECEYSRDFPVQDAVFLATAALDDLREKTNE
jgi:hypothetical protein